MRKLIAYERRLTIIFKSIQKRNDEAPLSPFQMNIFENCVFNRKEILLLFSRSGNTTGVSTAILNLFELLQG